MKFLKLKIVMVVPKKVIVVPKKESFNVSPYTHEKNGRVLYDND